MGDSLIQADQKLLSWLMKGPVEYNKISREIDFKVLYEALEDDYKSIFKTIDKYFSQYKTPPSYDILIEKVEDLESLHLINCMQENQCKDSEILYYLDLIRERYNQELAYKLVKSVPDLSTDLNIKEFNSNLQKVSVKIERLRKSAVFAEGDFRKSVSDRYNDYKFTEENPGIAAGILSGFRELDEYTNGIKESEFMIISGASSSGKSLMMMNYAINAWKGSNDPLDPSLQNFKDGKNIIFFSLEMSKKQMEQRIDSSLAGIRHKALTRGFLSLEEKQKWKQSLNFQKKYDKYFYIVDMPRGSRTLDIEAKYDAILSEFEPDLIVVDYLGIMKPNQDFGQDWLEVGHIAADLHEFCRTKNKAVLSAAQRKTKQKNSKNQSEDLEELGRSKMIGDNANIVVLIESREDELLREDSIFHVVKNRDGAKGDFKLLKNFELSKFSNMPDNWSLDIGEENELK